MKVCHSEQHESHRYASFVNGLYLSHHSTEDFLLNHFLILNLINLNLYLIQDCWALLEVCSLLRAVLGLLRTFEHG